MNGAEVLVFILGATAFGLMAVHLWFLDRDERRDDRQRDALSLRRFEDQREALRR